MSYPTAVRLAHSGELKVFRLRHLWRMSDVGFQLLSEQENSQHG